MPDLAFIILTQAKQPSAKDVIARAKQLGIALVEEKSDGMLSFSIGSGGSLIAMLVNVQHPDAPGMPCGVTSPSPDEIAATTAHFIVTALGIEGTPRERDTKIALLASTIIDGNAVGAMLGHGVMFHKAGLFAEMAALGVDGAIPPEIAIDITAAQESEIRMSFLTHNMPRYGREDFFVTCPIKGKGALDFVFGLVRWMLDDPDKQLPTGDTVGRSADELVKVQRVRSPTGSDAQVIKLDLR